MSEVDDLIASRRFGQLQRGWDEVVLRDYPRRERLADAVVHVTGIVLGALACIVLLVIASHRGEGTRAVALAIYGAGLMAMLGCSAAYHLSHEPARRRLFRRFDHAAIFLMIAGTYTPFLLIAIGGRTGLVLLAFVWAVALAGAAFKGLGLRCPEWLSVSAYLALGWAIMGAPVRFYEAMSSLGLVLLALGGAIYCIGVVFHQWRRLPYHNVIWHSLVLVAAACHYVAILHDAALA